MAAQINDLLKEIKELEILATEYWTTGGSSKDVKLIEVKIRGLLFVIAEFEAQADVLFRKHKEPYQVGIDKLFRTATGGTFETKGRRADFARAISVKEASAAVTAICRRSRQDSAGILAVYWLVRRSCFKGYRLMSLALNRFVTFVCAPMVWLSRRKMRPLF